MGNDDLFKRRKQERIKRKENIRKLNPSKWLIICEGEKTEPNYFKKAIEDINKKYKVNLKVEIKGLGKNTVSLVKSVDEFQKSIDKFNKSIVSYGKIFVVFDKDSFTNELFNQAIELCHQKGYIPLWSNQAFEYWFLLHFNYIDSRMDRGLYANKLNEYFKKAGLNYKYHKNDEEIYFKLCKYGSLENAIEYAQKIFLSKQNQTPSQTESCTTVYNFFLQVEEAIEELNK